VVVKSVDEGEGWEAAVKAPLLMASVLIIIGFAHLSSRNPFQQKYLAHSVSGWLSVGDPIARLLLTADSIAKKLVDYCGLHLACVLLTRVCIVN